jgi:hypothetical protein
LGFRRLLPGPRIIVFLRLPSRYPLLPISYFFHIVQWGILLLPIRELRLLRREEMGFFQTEEQPFSGGSNIEFSIYGVDRPMNREEFEAQPLTNGFENCEVRESVPFSLFGDPPISFGLVLFFPIPIYSYRIRSILHS